MLPSKRAFQRRMPSVGDSQQPLVINLRNDAAKLARKTRLGKGEIQIPQRLDSCPKIGQAFSNLRCKTSQNVLNLLLCTFFKTNQFVVQFQSFQWFEEQRRTTGTRPVNDTGQFLAILD